MTSPFGDRDSRDWWQGLQDGQLRLQHCRDCSTYRWAPRAMCNECGSFAWEWSPVDGSATVVSWTLSRRAYTPGYEPPYVVVLVRLEAAPNVLMVGGWNGGGIEGELAVGLPVVPSFVELGTTHDGPGTLVFWRPAVGTSA
ncbi:zinc ribbon domain-containing protein [Nocardia rhamnosiphila]|uniref:Zn-ribbon domain-containing OB-fold protein n=1 Tax=Nocardia rhamnosiphila TaxID=426716 RepID=UPI0033C72675